MISGGRSGLTEQQGIFMNKKTAAAIIAQIIIPLCFYLPSPVGFVLAAALTGAFVEVPRLFVISARLRGRWEVR